MSDRGYLNRRLAAVCGRYCGACDAYLYGSCGGCGYPPGQKRRGECAVFTCCVTGRGQEHCGLCLDSPCQVFVSHTSPLEVARLYKALHDRVEMGTAVWLDGQQRMHRQEDKG